MRIASRVRRIASSKYLAASVVAALLAMPAAAMFEEDESSIRAAGMAGAFTAVADDASAAWFNPAGLYQVNNCQFHGFYRLLYGGVGVNLHTGHAGFGLPTRRIGTVVLSLQETGYELHSERMLSLAHGFRLAKDIGVGYGLNGYNLYQKNVGIELQDVSGFAFGLDLGMFARVYRVWTVGFRVHNFNAPRIGTSAQGELPQSVAFGVGFAPSPGIHSAIDLTKEPGRSTQVRVGQEFRIIRDHLTLRAGVQTAPVRLAFGLRTGIRNVHIDYALRTHSELPLTHDLGLVIEF